MTHEHENSIKCPYCDHEENDSWEFGEDDGTWDCGACGEEFAVTRHVEVTYSSQITPCKDDKHDYQLDHFFICKRHFKKGKWLDLKEPDWEYVKIMECSICGDKDYIYITKQKYYSEKETLPKYCFLE
jgi:transcription elongation factor Elf1